MKKLLALIFTGAVVYSGPAYANDSVSVTVTGTVAPRCEVSALVRQVADNNSNAIGIGYDVNTGTTGQTFASSQIDLASTAPQRIADVTARCNTPSATLQMATDNNFRLRNLAGSPGDAVPFALNVLGQGGASGIAADFTTVIANTGPGPTQQQVRGLQFVLPSAANPINLSPGTYSDTIRITVTPNP
jgi:spore coat protein U-like protein